MCFPTEISGKSISAIGESTKLSDHQLRREHHTHWSIFSSREQQDLSSFNDNNYSREKTHKVINVAPASEGLLQIYLQTVLMGSWAFDLT